MTIGIVSLAASTALVAASLAVPAQADSPATEERIVLVEAGAGPAEDYRPLGRALGVGLTGGPIGVSLKYYLTPAGGVQVGVGSFWGHGWLSAYADYIHALATLYSAAEGTLYPYVGGGVGFGIFSGPSIPVSEPLAPNPLAADVHLTAGLGWNFRALPVDLFIETGPELKLLPHIGAAWHGVMGARYYF